MQQLKAFKYTIYPIESLRGQVAKIFGAKCWMYNQIISGAITEMREISVALQKMTGKIERPSINVLAGHGSGQAAYLYVRSS